MKFETPLVKFMVTADGPACFDIDKEGKEVIDILASGGTAKICQCLCECLCECRVPCSCICECMCLCKCECICTCPAPSRLGAGQEKVSADTGIKVLGQNVAFGSKFMLRRESFGGLLFNKESFLSYLCNHSAFEILRFIENQPKGLSMAKISTIVDHLRHLFEEVPENAELVVLAFLCGCNKQTLVEIV